MPTTPRATSRRRSLPQIVAIVAAVLGGLLFLATLSSLDLDETLGYVRRLGLAFPLVLAPSALWHVLRTWGWWTAFPEDARPSFARLLRVRLAADAVSYFTIRGVTGDPLKVVLLYDRSPPTVTAAAVAAERLAFGIMAAVVAGLASQIVVTRLSMPSSWDAAFTALSFLAIAALVGTAMIMRRRSEHYLMRAVMWADRFTGRRLEASRVIRFVLDVESILLELLRGTRRRLVVLTVLPVVCYGINTFEIWLVFWIVGEPIGVSASLAIETFARVASIATGMVPASLGTLEASHAAIVTALGLSGGGALVLARRVRSLLWAAVGLAWYPRLPPGRAGQSDDAGA